MLIMYKDVICTNEGILKQRFYMLLKLNWD